MTFSFKGVHMAPSQTFGAVRIVPILRSGNLPKLFLHNLDSVSPISIVDVEPGIHYVSFVPHAFVARLDEGKPQSTLGAQMWRAKDHREPELFQTVHRMAKRKEDALRFLPLHLAMEYFLALYFGGPDIVWPEYSRKALRRGLSPRYEHSRTGYSIDGLEEALRMFEIHDGQVGVALFVADALASIFITPRPDDYKRLHKSLLVDFYGELIWQYACLYDQSAELHVTFDEKRVSSLASLEAELARARADWASGHQLMLGDVLDRPLERQRVTRLGGFELERFMTKVELDGTNHIGEAIVDESTHEVVYLKTFRMSEAQSRRAHLLKTLAANEWHLENAAIALNTNKKQLVQRIISNGFGDLLKSEVITDALK